jgi:ABC-type lipoprotein release transport system permease subunit
MGGALRSAGRVAWYRFRVTFRHRWPGYLTVVLLVGLLGGLAMGAIAGARRTESSFPKYLASTHPSDLLVLRNDSANDDNTGDPAFLRELAHLPHIARVESATSPTQQLLAPDGSVAHDATHERFDATVQMTADVNGEFFDQDRPSVLEGRMLDPKRADEMVLSAGAAGVLHAHVGTVIPFAFYTNKQTNSPDYGTGKQTPVRRIGIKLVGIVVFHSEIIRDDIDSTLRLGLFSPALTDPLATCCSNTPIIGVRLDHGNRDDVAVASEINARANAHVIQITAVQEATAERAVKPQSFALGVFGAIAALATLLIAGQVIGRQLRNATNDLETLRALGANPSMTVTDGLIGVVGAIAAGAVLAALIAVALSPLSPLGPVRPVYPGRSIAFDWTVLGAGVAMLIVLLAALATLFAYRDAPHRIAKRVRRIVPRRSRIAGTAAASGLPISGVTGIRLALDPGRDTRAVPLRSATLGAVLAIVVVVGTVVFGASLNTLVSHPALYGWNWSYEMIGNYGGIADVPLPQAGKLLDRDANVAAWSRASFGDLRIDGRDVPVLGTTPHAEVGPPVLSGHALEGPNQIVLGASTIAALHKHVGDTVELDNGLPKPVKLVIVGTATLPAIGAIESLHLEIGTGAVISEQLIPPQARGFGDLPTSPEAVLIRFRAGVRPAVAYRSLQRIAQETNVLGHGPPNVLPVQRPAEIVNYRTMGSTPAFLGAALAAGAVAALGLTLFASVRRRRRDLALFKTLGFTRRQLAATVAWQASISVTLGVIFGIPAGIVIGRTLWDRFAEALHVVPDPTVPAVTIALIAAGALVLTNVVAAIPGRQAARTKTAVLLRAE